MLGYFRAASLLCKSIYPQRASGYTFSVQESISEQGILVLWWQIMDNICNGSRTTSCPVGRRKNAPCPLENSQALPGRRQRGAAPEGVFLAGGSKQLEEPLLVQQAKSSGVLGRGREQALEGAVFHPTSAGWLRSCSGHWDLSCAAQQKVPAQSPPLQSAAIHPLQAWEFL